MCMSAVLDIVTVAWMIPAFRVQNPSATSSEPRNLAELDAIFNIVDKEFAFLLSVLR